MSEGIDLKAFDESMGGGVNRMVRSLYSYSRGFKDLVFYH